MPTTASRRWCCTTFIPALLAAAACGSTSDPTGPTVAAVAGAYTLRDAASGADTGIAVTATSLVTVAAHVTRTLKADGTCNEAGQFTSIDEHLLLSSPNYKPVTYAGTTLQCTWALSGRTITFTRVSGESWYDQTTVATVNADGSLTEQNTSGPSGLDVYPRTYRR